LTKTGQPILGVNTYSELFHIKAIFKLQIVYNFAINEAHLFRKKQKCITEQMLTLVVLFSKKQDCKSILRLDYMNNKFLSS